MSLSLCFFLIYVSPYSYVARCSFLSLIDVFQPVYFTLYPSLPLLVLPFSISFSVCIHHPLSLCFFPYLCFSLFVCISMFILISYRCFSTCLFHFCTLLSLYWCCLFLPRFQYAYTILSLSPYERPIAILALNSIRFTFTIGFIREYVEDNC